MQLAPALRSFLIANAQLAAIIGNRSRTSDTVPEWAQLPDVFFTIESAPELPGDTDDLNQYTVTLVARSSQSLQAQEIAALLAHIIPTIENASITVGSETAAPFESVSLEDEGTDEDPEQITGDKGTSRWVYATRVQFSCWFRAQFPA